MAPTIPPRRAAPTLLGVLLALAAPAGALEIVSTSPARYERAVPDTLTRITVTLDATVVTPPAAAVRVAGTMSGIHPTTVTQQGTTLLVEVPGDWQPGELVHVNLRRDVHTAPGDSLLGGRYFAFTIASAPVTLAWSDPTAHPAADVPYFIFGGDLDGDGNPDVAAPNEGTNDFSVWLNTSGTGAFGGHADYPVGNTPSSCFGEDLDNDGDLDLATADIATGTLSVALNHGDGTFAPRATYPAGITTRQVYGGDFDGDNDVDLCTTSKATNEVFLFYNRGDGSFDPGVPFADVQNGPFAILTGDFDLDGHLDIGVACRDADSVTVLTNDGDGTFTTTGRFKTGDGPWDMSGNDMDGDGDFDLVTVSSFNNRIQVLFNDGTGGFPTKTGAFAGFFPLGVFTADLDGDGDLDAMASNFQSGTVGIYENGGSGNLSLSTTLAVSRSGSYAWAHDLDGDGDLDLSVVDELADTLFVFFQQPPVDAPLVSGSSSGGPRLAAYPNPAPASSGTDLSVTGLTGSVTIDVFTVAGRRVRRLFAGEMARAGSLVWDGRGDSGRPLPAGAYVVVARGAGGSASAVVRLLR